MCEELKDLIHCLYHGPNSFVARAWIFDEDANHLEDLLDHASPYFNNIKGLTCDWHKSSKFPGSILVEQRVPTTHIALSAAEEAQWDHLTKADKERYWGEAETAIFRQMSVYSIVEEQD